MMAAPLSNRVKEAKLVGYPEDVVTGLEEPRIRRFGRHVVLVRRRRAPADVVAVARAPDDVVEQVVGTPDDVVAHDTVRAPHDVVVAGRAPDDVVESVAD